MRHFSIALAFRDQPLALYDMLQDVAVDYGSTLDLICPIVYVNDDPVIVEWYRDGILIDIKYETHFTITSQHKDGGLYHCVAVQGGRRISSNMIRVKIRGICNSCQSYCDVVMF